LSADPLSREAIGALDRAGMLEDVLQQPLQVGDALWRVQSADLRRRDLPGGLVVCGMGGSAIGGDLALGALGDRATRPIRVVRDYGLYPWATGDSLVLCSSYSGDTEETLACFEIASIAEAPRVVATTGGELAEAARTGNVPVIGIPSGMQPRAAVIYMTVVAIECAAASGASQPIHSEIDSLAPLLTELAEEWGPDSPADSDAKRIARDLQGKMPVVHGTGPTAAPARRWKTQLNENAEVGAFLSILPEANHNEICSWDWTAREAPLAGVFLEDSDQHPRMARRIELTAQAFERAGAECMQVSSRGETRLQRVLSLVLLGDLVSVYLAVLNGVDPTPVESIERFKAELADRQP
jgi:glucose/mannose-6-phosphate isomerase